MVYQHLNHIVAELLALPLPEELRSLILFLKYDTIFRRLNPVV